MLRILISTHPTGPSGRTRLAGCEKTALPMRPEGCGEGGIAGAEASNSDKNGVCAGFLRGIGDLSTAHLRFREPGIHGATDRNGVRACKTPDG
jgi:hypothetical protein